MDTDETTPLLRAVPEVVKTSNGEAVTISNGEGVGSVDDIDSPLAGIAKVHAKDETEEKFALRKLTKRNKLVLLLLALSNFFTGCGFSLLAPFFPQEAEKKGVSTTVTGLIFSVFQFMILISSPVYGNFLTRIGAKFLFVSGILVGGTCAVLFGTLHRSPPGAPFIIICFACRCVEALGLSAFITSSFAIISNEFPKHVATVFGLLETANGIGLMAGPALGGFLYEVGGFGLPFFVIGASILATGTLMFFFLPPPDDVKHERKASVLSLLKSPMVWFSSLGILASSIALVFLDPTFAKHLEQFDLSKSVIGLIFVIAPGLYGITSPIWGYISDSTGHNPPLIIAGSLMCGIGFLLIGPTPFLDFLPVKLWVIIIGLVLAGAFFAAIVGPSMKCLLQGALDIGFENNLDTYGVVSGLFVSVFSIGAFLSPMMAGFLVDEIGFRYGVTVVSGINFFAMICTSIYFITRWFRRRTVKDELYIRYNSVVPQAVIDERMDTSSYIDQNRTFAQHSV